MSKNGWLNRNVWGFSLASLFSDLGHELVTSLTPSFLVALGAPAIALGAIEGVSGLAQSLANLRAGRWADELDNRKPLLLLGYVGTVIKCLYAIVGFWPWLVLLRTLAWLARGMRGPLRDSLISETVAREEIGRAMGFREMMDTVGALIGPLLAVLLLASWGFRALFWLSGAASAVSVLMVFLYVNDHRLQGRTTTSSPPRPAPPTSDRSMDAATSALDAARIAADSKAGAHPQARVRLAHMPSAYRRLLATDALLAVGNAAPTFFILAATSAFRPDYGLRTAAVLGIALYAWHNVVYSLTAIVSGHLSDRYGPRALLLVGYAILAVALSGFATVPAALFAYATLFTLSGIAAGTQESVQKAYVSLSLPVSVRGRGLGWHAAVVGIGGLVSAAVIGSLWTLDSRRLAFAVATLFAVVAWVLLAMTVPKVTSSNDGASITVD